MALKFKLKMSEKMLRKIERNMYKHSQTNFKKGHPVKY